VEPPVRSADPAHPGTQLARSTDAVRAVGQPARTRPHARGRDGGGPAEVAFMRTMFALYALVILTGLVLYITVGLAHL
jgi:hypothetical protein